MLFRSLVPDSVTNDMVKDRLNKDDLDNGFLLDGYPRNVAQAEVLRAVLAEKVTPLHAALELNIDPEEIVARLSGRRSCSNCQKPYHVVNEKPAVEGICDACGGALIQREDDKAEVIKHRLNVYAEQTAPIINFYRNEGLLITINASGPVSEITASAISALSRVK